MTYHPDPIFLVRYFLKELLLMVRCFHYLCYSLIKKDEKGFYIMKYSRARYNSVKDVLCLSAVARDTRCWDIILLTAE
jgi:hypothetical protein